MQSEPAPATTPPIDPARIDPDAKKVIRRLKQHHHKAYLVGGCVRDLLLDETPKDFDIATSARPRQVRRLFRNSRIIGRRFRLVHIRFGDRILDVATFRRAPPKTEDDPYVTADNAFGSEREDAFRRDFTINGLFYDVVEERVVDHVGGMEDLAQRRLRTIGDAEFRVQEDPVRILRAARFAGRLGFTLCDELRDAARRHGGDLRKGAPPRVLEELYRLVTTRGAARCFRMLEELGGLAPLLPEIVPLTDRFYESLERVEEQFGGVRGLEWQWLAFAVLLSPFAIREMLACSGKDVDVLLAEKLGSIAARLTVARRDSTRARLCLAAQARFLEPPQGRTARRFAQRDFFSDALVLRHILGPLEDVDPDPLPAWEELQRPPGGSPPKRRRRRSRRGGKRRRLKRGAGEGRDEACEPTSPSSSAPAPETPPAPSPKDSSNGGSPPA
ncbi:MAG: polynucleotide adenylyltransferase PcnB [Planctomycetota bacterium]|nr:polynucleotide adenylyltransferase PcnB [Planctomycetota bacterium]